MAKHRRENKSALLFGEGRQETFFFELLESSHKFKDLCSGWTLKLDHASGESCKKILEKCISVCCHINYDLVLCFIDTDQLHELGANLEENRLLLERMAMESKLNIRIIWQESNHEDELCRALGNSSIKKNSIKSHIKRNGSRQQKVINSPFTKKILKYFSDN